MGMYVVLQKREPDNRTQAVNMEECVDAGAQTPKLSLTVKISNWDWVLKKWGKS
jgi:hypothetical protein